MLTLKKNYEFQRVFKKGSWYGGNYFSIYISPNKKNSNYIGIAISKKVSKSSVKRNHLRRLIREAYRVHESECVIGFDIVFVWKISCSAENVTFHDIEEDFLKCFRKGQLLREKGESNA